MIRLSAAWAWVRALKLLQNSMMLTPCWPRAGPTGGEGLALPAGSCNLTYPVIFFIARYLSAAVTKIGAGSSGGVEGRLRPHRDGDQRFSTAAKSSSTLVGRPKIDT